MQLLELQSKRILRQGKEKIASVRTAIPHSWDSSPQAYYHSKLSVSRQSKDSSRGEGEGVAFAL